MTIICQISLVSLLLFLVMYYVHIKWLVGNFYYVFLLQLIAYYLLITNPVWDIKKIVLEFE